MILLHAAIFDGPAPLIETLTSITGAVYLILPGGVEGNIMEQIKAIPSVKDVRVGDLNLAEFARRSYENAIALRHTLPSVTSQAVWNGGASSAAAAWAGSA